MVVKENGLAIIFNPYHLVAVTYTIYKYLVGTSRIGWIVRIMAGLFVGAARQLFIIVFATSDKNLETHFLKSALRLSNERGK